MDPIRPDRLELSSLELEKLAIFEFVSNPASANIDQSAPIIVKICMDTRMCFWQRKLQNTVEEPNGLTSIFFLCRW